MSKERKFTLYEGGGVGSFGGPKPDLKLVEDFSKDHELEVPDFLLENSSSRKAILLEKLAKYNTHLLVSQNRLLESSNSNAIRLHCLLSVIQELTAPSHLDAKMPNGDIEYYVDNFIATGYSKKEARARGVTTCGAVDMALDILENQKDLEAGEAERTFFNQYTSPTWNDNSTESKLAAQEDLARLIEGLLHEATGEDMSREEVIEYFYKLKEIIALTLGLYEDEEVPSELEFLKNWRVIIKK